MRFRKRFLGIFGLSGRRKRRPIVGNEITGNAEELWKRGRWQRALPLLSPSLWRASLRMKERWRQVRKRGIPKYISRSLLALTVILLVGAVGKFSLHAEVAKFYPETCMGGWLSSERAQGLPDLPPDSPASVFNKDNSALLIPASASQIFCGSWRGEIPHDTSMKALTVKFSWAEMAEADSMNQERGTTTSEIAPQIEIGSEDTATASGTQAILDAPADASADLLLAPPSVPPEEETGGEPAEPAVEEAPAPEPMPSASPAPEEAGQEEPAPASAPAEELAPAPVPEEAGQGETEPAALTPVSFWKNIWSVALAQGADEIPDTAATPSTADNGNGGLSLSASRREGLPSVAAAETDSATTETNADGNQGQTSSTAEGLPLIAETTDEQDSASTLAEAEPAGVFATTTEERATTTDETSERMEAAAGFLTDEAPPMAPTPEFLEVRYTLDGTEWRSLGKVSRAEWKSEFTIPVSEWADISRLQVSIETLPSVEEPPKIYLDGMWLEAEYGDMNEMEDGAMERGSATISSVATVEGPSSSIDIETVNGSAVYVLRLVNPGAGTPDYKWLFTKRGVELLVNRKDGKEWVTLAKEIEPIPEYQAPGGDSRWNAYSLSLETSGSDKKDGWVKNGQVLARNFSTGEEGIAETFTESWAIPESAEDLGSKGPKASYSMTKNRGKDAFLWRMRWEAKGIKDIGKDADNLKDEEGWPIRNKIYGDGAFSLDVNDFDNSDATKDGTAKHVFSEKAAGQRAEVIFFPDGTSGERFIDPTTVTAGVSTGWGHNKTRAVFYTGERFWLLYTTAAGNIYYKSSTDNSTWTATSTLIINMSTTNVDFDTFLVDNKKFDLAYPNGSEDPIAVTVTINGSSLATSTASAVGAATTCNKISVARTPSNDRIFMACRETAEMETYSADQTGDANNITTWTDEMAGGESFVVGDLTIAPYGASDKVLVAYENNPGGTSSDGIHSRAITRGGGAGTEINVSVGNYNPLQYDDNNLGNLVRTESSTFSLVIQQTGGTTGLREYVWNDTSWSANTINTGTNILSPSLFYDETTKELYAFASSTAVVYYKKSAGAWGSAITADNGETGNRNNSFPVTQMNMAFPNEQTFLPWAYRITNGSNFDLKVGTMGLHGTTTQRAYFFLNDDGADVDSYTKSHAISATSTPITGVKIGERLIARIQVDNITAGTSTKMYRLQWRASGGNWADLSTTTAIRWSLSAKGAIRGRSGEVPLKTAQLGAAGACVTAGTTYQEGRFVAGQATSSVISLGPSKCTELAFAIETSGAAVNTAYELRLVNGQSGLPFDQAPLNGSYAAVPTFTTETSRTLTYSKEARGAVSASTTAPLDDPANAVGTYTSIAIGTDGFPVISYFDDTADSLKFYKCNNIACSSGTASTLDDTANLVGLYTSIAIGADGYPVISYRDATAFSLKFYKCDNTACSSGTPSTLDDPANSVGQYTSISIGTDGFPVISYYDDTANSLKFYKCANIACSSGTPSTLDDPANDVGYYTSLAIGADGFPVISYRDGTAGVLSLKFYKCNNTACSSGTPSTLDDPANSVGAYTSIAIGIDGFPAISYRDGTAGALKFYKCNNTACSSGTPSTLDDPANSVGEYISLAIGTDGYPVVSYYDTTAGALKFYKCDNVACSSGTPSTLDDPANNVGWYTSLAIGADGFPVVSYWDNTAFSLRFAKCNSIDCSVSATSSASNLPTTAANLANFLDDGGYANVATSNDQYDSLFAATSSRLAYNFKKASTTNTDQIDVTWEGQVSVSTTTSLQIYNNTSGAWETLQSSATPTASQDFTLTGSITGAEYYVLDSGYYLAAARLITGTTTQATTLKTDQITITFSPASSLTLSVSTDVFGALDPGLGLYRFATSTISVTSSGAEWHVAMYGNNQGTLAASTTLYLSPNSYSTSISDQTEWVPGSATTSAGNAVIRSSLDASGQVLAFRVMSASGSAPFRSTAWWGASDSDGTAKWAGIASSTAANRRIMISSIAAPTAAIGTVQYYLDAPLTQASGNYTGNITFTLVGSL